MTWDSRLNALAAQQNDQRPTSNANDKAAAESREEELQRTELAQMAPGHTAKALELLVNHNVAPGLLAAFEAAASSVRFQQEQQIYIQELDQQAANKQQQDEQADHDKQEQAWLAAMTPEYRAAYADLQATVADAHKEYDHLRQELLAQRQQLDAQAKDIDDNALHLSDGSRAYRNDKGQLVDKDGKELTGKDAQEAQALLAQHPSPISLYRDYERNQAGIDNNTKLTTRVNNEQADADAVGKKAANQGYKTPAEMAAEKAKTAKRLAATKAGVEEKQANDTKMAALPSGPLDLDAPPPAAAHSSFASQVDPNAGIHANSVTNTFNAATQATTPAIPATVTPPKPLAAPAPG